MEEPDQRDMVPSEEKTTPPSSDSHCPKKSADMENPPPLGGDSLRLWIKLCKIINLIIRKGRKARKYSICAALGNFVLIVFYRNLSYLDEKWCTNGLKWT